MALLVGLALVALLVGAPLLTLLHELGHALTAATLMGGRAMIVQGPPPPRVIVSVWRLDLVLHGPVGPHHGWVGWAIWSGHRDRWRHVLALAAGPAASAVCAGACAAGVVLTSGWARVFLLYLVFSAGLQSLSTGLPVRYGRFFGAYAGEASDALRILRILQGRPEPAPAPLGV